MPSGTNGANGHGEPPPDPAAQIATLPESWDQAQVEQIIERISNGETLREICRDIALPESTFRRWVIANHSGLAAQYARARELQMECWADRLVELAQTVKMGVTVESSEKNGVTVREGDMIERSRLEMDALKWLMSKVNRHRYGDSSRVDTTITDRKMVVIEINPNRNHAAQMERDADLADPIELANERPGE